MNNINFGDSHMPVIGVKQYCLLRPNLYGVFINDALEGGLRGDVRQ